MLQTPEAAHRDRPVHQHRQPARRPVHTGRSARPHRPGADHARPPGPHRPGDAAAAARPGRRGGRAALLARQPVRPVDRRSTSSALGFPVIEVDDFDEVPFPGGQGGGHAVPRRARRPRHPRRSRPTGSSWPARRSSSAPTPPASTRSSTATSASHLGKVDMAFLGMECDGAPLTWLYQGLLTRPVTKKMSDSRKLSGSNAAQAGGDHDRARRRRGVHLRDGRGELAGPRHGDHLQRGHLPAQADRRVPQAGARTTASPPSTFQQARVASGSGSPCPCCRPTASGWPTSGAGARRARAADHGIGRPPRVWTDYQTPALQQAGYRRSRSTTAASRPSDAPPGRYSLADMVADTKGLIEALGLAPCRIVGYSLGSMIAQELAIRCAGSGPVRGPDGHARHGRTSYRRAAMAADRALRESGVKLPAELRARQDRARNAVAGDLERRDVVVASWLEVFELAGDTAAPGQSWVDRRRPARGAASKSPRRAGSSRSPTTSSRRRISAPRWPRSYRQ